VGASQKVGKLKVLIVVVTRKKGKNIFGVILGQYFGVLLRKKLTCQNLGAIKYNDWYIGADFG